MSTRHSNLALAVCVFALNFLVNTRVPAQIAFDKGDGKLDISIDGQPFATYVWKDERTTRPYFKHVRVAGIQVTRNHPPQTGDFQDHETYHPGVWWGFGDVGGNDYWRMKAKVIGGEFLEGPKGGGRGAFTVRNEMLTNDGEATFCEQICRYTILRRTNGVLMICESTMTRRQSDFWLGDQEEMGLAARVATPLAVESEKGGRIVNSQGQTSLKEIRTNQADWCDYSGPIEGKYAGIMIMSDPENFRRPWWHAVVSGLLIANPLGESELSGRGKRSENWLVREGEPFRLRYGVLIHVDPAEDKFDPKQAYVDFLETIGSTPSLKNGSP